MGFDALATGHHARVERDDAGRSWIRRGADPAKDQSYVLSVLPGDAVGDTLLPVGDLTKAEVRDRAVALGLRTATKAESMDVCFIRRDERGSFLQDRLPAAPGVVVDVDGAPLGEHDGVAGFTIGQRRGTGVAAGERRYVVDLDAATATVVLGTRADLLRDRIDLVGLAPVHDALPDGSRVLVQTSAHGEPAAATLEGSSVRLDAARQRVAPGQVVALYVGDRVVAGAYAG
jgi:tRNA-specific 2-thiouridylase